MTTDAGDGLFRAVIQNGDLSFIREPLLLGHYRSAILTGTERVMNRRIGNAMEQALALGHYPGAAGSCEVFINTVAQFAGQTASPEAVIVVGLGDEGKLKGAALAQSVERAVIAWSKRVKEKGDQHPVFDLATTLIGSGGLGVSVGQSAQSIVEGVCEANAALRATGWPTVNRLSVVELYLDRATEAWRALRVQLGDDAESNNEGFLLPTDQVRVGFALQDTVRKGAGSLKRPLEAGYRGAGYDLVTIRSETGKNGDAVIAYTLNTKRARSEVTASSTQRDLVRRLVRVASNDGALDADIPGALFKLLIPAELEPFLVTSTELQLQLTADTAAIPWELLDPGSEPQGARVPWAIRNKLIRSLGTSQVVDRARDATADDSVLVIGEPKVTNERYPELPGARREANKVVESLIKGGVNVSQLTPLIALDGVPNSGPDETTVIKTLFARPWRIIHISGHGEDPEGENEHDAASRGVLLSNGIVLGPKEMEKLRVVPELVFLNCCHLARDASGSVLTSAPAYDRPRFAANVAEALIRLGVRCVVAAGWAVEDEPASRFAVAFYGALMRGMRFIDAVAEGRQAAYRDNSNTWAAYQCYGDPDWYFRRQAGDPQKLAKPQHDEYDGIVSPSGLRLALHTISSNSTYRDADQKETKERLTGLENRFVKRWGRDGSIAEAFGVAWSDAGYHAQAVDWFRVACDAPDGSATLKAVEQLANVGARVAWEEVNAVVRKLRLTFPYESDKPLRSLPSASRQALNKCAKAARSKVAGSLTLLEKLSGLTRTAERSNLTGSVFKRLAMIEAATGDQQAAQLSIARMLTSYKDAEELSKIEPDADVFYAASNILSAEITQHAGTAGWGGLSPRRVSMVRESLEHRDAGSPTIWTKLGLIELELYDALASGTLGERVDELLERYGDLKLRVNARRFWATTYDHLQFVFQRYMREARPNQRLAARRLLQKVGGWC